MLKKILSFLLLVIFTILIYVFQLYFFNNLTFWGVHADLPLVFLIVFALCEKTKAIYVFGVILGVISDILFYTSFGKYLLIYLIVCTILISFKNTYKQESKAAIAIFSVVGTITSVAILYIFNIFEKKEFLNLLFVLWQSIKLLFVNLFFCYIIYLVYAKTIKKLKLGD